MNAQRSLHLALAFAGLLFAGSQPVHAVVYQFTIEESRGGRAIGTGDAARSQALRFSNGDMVVSIPLNTLSVPGLSTDIRDPGYLDIYTPPSGVVPAVASQQYYAEMGGAPPAPFCTGTGPGCVVPLGYAYVSWMSLPVDIWGRFEGSTWIPNPDPGAHSFTTLPPLGGTAFFPGSFSMVRVIPEPSVALLFGIGLGAVALRRRARGWARCCAGTQGKIHSVNAEVAEHADEEQIFQRRDAAAQRTDSTKPICNAETQRTRRSDRKVWSVGAEDKRIFNAETQGTQRTDRTKPICNAETQRTRRSDRKI